LKFASTFAFGAEVENIYATGAKKKTFFLANYAIVGDALKVIKLQQGFKECPKGHHGLFGLVLVSTHKA